MKEQYEKLDSVFKKKLISVEESNELEALNNIIKIYSEAINESGINKILNKLFIIKNLKTNKFKPVAINLKYDEYLFDDKLISNLIKDFNKNNEDLKIVGVPIIFYGLIGVIDCSKISKEEADEVLSLMKQMKKLNIKKALIKNSSDIGIDLPLSGVSDIEEELQEISDKLKEKLGKDINSHSVNIKYNKYSTYSMLEYDSIESSNGNLCISDKPKNINIQNYNTLKTKEVTQFSPQGGALFGDLSFNYFE